MMSSKLYTFFFVLFLIACTVGGHAQSAIPDKLNLSDTTQIHIITTQRGDVFIGHILEIDRTKLLFKMVRQTEPLSFELNEIVGIEIDEPTGGKPTTTQETLAIIRDLRERPDVLGYQNLLLYPTAFNFPKNEREYRNILLLWNTVEWGITDNISVGAGFFIPVSVITRVKASWPIGEWVHVGAAAHAFFNIRTLDRGNGFSHIHALLTIGKPEYHLSFSGGYTIELVSKRGHLPTATPEAPPEPTPAYGMGGAVQINPTFKVLVDILYQPTLEDQQWFPGFGASWFKDRHRVDFGFFFFPDFQYVAGTIPVVAYGLKF